MSYASVSKITNNAPYVLLVLLSVFPLLNVNLISILITVFYIFSVVFRLKTIKENIKKIGAKPLVVNSLFYVILIVSILYSPAKNKGLDVVVREISFLLMPLVLIYSIKISDRLIKIMVGVFIVSNIVVMLYLTYKLNLISDLIEQPKQVFNKRYFLEIGTFDFKDLHATYIALNNIISVLILIKFVFSTQNIKKKIGAISLIFMFTLFLFVLNSRVIIIISLLAIPLFIFLKLKTLKYKLITVMILVLSITALVITSKTHRLGRLFVKPVEHHINNFNAEDLIGVRYKIQECSIELISKKPILGYGLGYEKILLPNYCFEIKNFKNVHLKTYTSHNVYLFIIFAAGIPALIAFLFLLINNFAIAFRHKDIMYILLLGIFTFAFLTENYFIRINGILLFAFINSYFYNKNFKKIE